MNGLKIGAQAPNFVTIGVYKNRLGKIRLSDYYGKKYIILLFYPSNFTAVSSAELIQLNEKLLEFRKLSAQVLAISIDSPFSHLHYILSRRSQGGVEQLNYPLLSDLNRTVTKNYKLLADEGFSFPGSIIIDKEGIVQYYTVNTFLCGRNIGELIRVLKAIQYVKKKPGQVCYIDWKNEKNILYSHPLKSKLYFKTLYSKRKK